MSGSGDYISREAAIAVIYGQHVGGKEACENARPNTYGADLREIVADIEDIPAADVRPVVRCGNCSIHDKCSTEDVFKFAGLSEDNRFCAAGRTKNGTMDAETRRLKRGLSLNELGYPYDLPNREG